MTMKKLTLQRWFIFSAGGILLITGLAKIFSAHGNAKILDLSDPIFKISFRRLMFLVGNLELIISAFCFFGKKIGLQISAIAWLAGVFILYRIGLMAVGYRRPCPCLGSLTDALHISPETTNLTGKIFLAYLSIGSCCSLFYLLRRNKLTVVKN
jgi:hypothetical protein